MYDMMLISLGVTAPNPLHFDNSHSPVVSQTFYLGLIIVSFLVLINLLIAMFNERVGILYEYKSTLMSLQKVNFMFLMQVYVEACYFIVKPIKLIHCRLRKGSECESQHCTIFTIEGSGIGHG